MKTVGEILKNQRLKNRLTLEEISRKTKIQEKYLHHLEENDFKNLPTGTFVKGFIQNYAKAIGTDPNTALAIFRRDFAEDRKGRIIPRSLIAPIEKKIVITPRTITYIFCSITALLIGGIFARQLIVFYTGPEINIETPLENQTVTSPVEVNGSVNNATMLKINNQEVVLEETGQFSKQFQLSPGDHTITFSATSRDGKTKIVQRHVVVSP